MDDENEVEGVFVGDTIEDEHGLDGKVPGTGTVGGGHDDGYGADDEGYEGTAKTEMGGEVEAEEGKVVVEEVAEPDGYGEEGEQRNVLDVLQRDDALPDTAKCRAYLIIYGKFAQEEVEQDEHGDGTDGHDEIACPGESVEDVVEVGARLAEEGAEGAHLQQDDDGGDAHDEQGVDGSLGDYGAQGFGERHVIVALQYTTARELAYAGNDQRSGIGEEDAVDAGGRAWMLANGL